MEAPTHLTAAFSPSPAMANVVMPAKVVPRSVTHLPLQSAAGHPHVLLVAASNLASTARLGMELRRAGAAVSLISPPGHPARSLQFFKEIKTHGVWRPWKLLESCLLSWRPDAIIPCDERTVRDLHQLHACTSHRMVRELVERSLGPASVFSTVRSRERLLSMARALGVRVPESMAVPDETSLDTWMRSHPAPFVIKADGSWAGFGVRIISDHANAHQAWRQMRQPTTLYMGTRALLLEHDAFGLRSWARTERPLLSVQAYVDGWPANIGIACWQGKVLATSCAEAVSTVSATGPSTVARIIQNAEMVEAATSIVHTLGLSGMIGFDFMIEAATGHAYLIEMNPRVTPICTVPLGPRHDLPEGFVACLAGRVPQDRPPRTDREIIAYFPDTWHQDPENHLLQSGFHDVPWDEPALVRRLLRTDAVDRYWALRVMRQLRKRMVRRQTSTT